MTIKRYLALAMFCFFTQAFAAQSDDQEGKLAEPADKKNDFANLIYSDVGIDHSMLTLGIGYGLYFDVEAIQRRLLLFADYALPIASLDIRDFRVRTGIRTSAIEIGSFYVPVWLSFSVNGAQNKIFRATGLGSELGIAPGYYGRVFAAASELYCDQTWAAYLKHSQAYRDLFYANAKDGWYSMPSTSFRAGLYLAWNIHKRFTLGFKGGYQQMGQYNKLIPPIYGTLHTEFSF